MSDFKVGDRVRVIHTVAGVFFDQGTVGTVKSINHTYNQPYNVKSDAGMSQWCSESQLELVTEAPKRPFKVGDKVRIVKQRKSNISFFGVRYIPSILDDTVYTISKVDNSCLPYSCHKEGKILDYWCTAEQLELVEESRLIPKDSFAQSTTTHTFEVGDKVRVIDHELLPSTLPVTWVPSMNEYCGKIGTIGIITQSGVINVVFDDDANWSFDPAWLTPVTEITFGGRSIADAWREAIASLCNPKKDKTNIKTKLISNTKLLTNLKLK